jgi:hypothetical protein
VPGFRIWLWIATAMAIVMLVVAATVLRERRGQVIQKFTAVPERMARGGGAVMTRYRARR